MNLPSITRPFLALCVLAAMPFALSACDTVDDETVSRNPPPQNVEQAPPQQPEPEITPLIATPQTEIWRPGYWALINRDFVWVPGKIIARPGPTAVWATARWTHHSFGWSFAQGHWE